MNGSKVFVFFTIYFNVFLAVVDRLCQIIYYGLTDFNNSTIKGSALSFILIYPGANILMIILYLISHKDYGITVRKKIKYFFIYILSAEACYSIGAFKVLKNQFTYPIASEIIVIKKVLNTMHLVFVSITQLLIVTVYSSSVGEFQTIDILSLIFSSLFITWSGIYFVLCTVKENDYEAELSDVLNGET